MSLLRSMCILVLVLLPLRAVAFDPGIAPFTVQAGKTQVSYTTFFVNVLPGDILPLAVVGPAEGSFDAVSSAGKLEANGARSWRWQAPPEPGHARVMLQRTGDGARVVLNVFVLKPLQHAENGALRGYRIGQYPGEPLRGNPVYLPPDGLIHVTRDMVGLQVSPNFTLGQFLCKQQPDHWPKYAALRPQLLVKLETILAEVNRRGIAVPTLSVLSGYRTPWYNAAIKNGAYSRHIWGGAADIFIDTTGNGWMDDLNGDGRVDLADARWLLDLVDSLFAREDTPTLPGGRGLYGPRPHRGPFVHVDARGWPAYWEMP